MVAFEGITCIMLSFFVSSFIFLTVEIIDPEFLDQPRGPKLKKILYKIVQSLNFNKDCKIVMKDCRKFMKQKFINHHYNTIWLAGWLAINLLKLRLK